MVDAENKIPTKLALFFKARRLVQIFWALEATLILLAVYHGIMNQTHITLILILTMIGISSVYWLAKHAKTHQAGIVLLSTITLLLTYFTWKYGGIHDEVVLAYPCVLIMAAMFTQRNIYVSLVLFLCLSLATNAIVNDLGLYTNVTQKVSINGAVITLAIFVLISFAVWVAAKDYRSLLEKLYLENIEVSN